MTITHVQSSNFTDLTSAASISTSFLSTVGSGNCVCGIVSWDVASGTSISSVTDDKGNTYNLETTVLDNLNNQNSAAFSRTNITGGPTVITANFSASTGSRKIIVEEFAGTSTASTDERDGAAHGGQLQTNVASGTDVVSSGNFTTSTDGDLLFGGTIDSSGTNTISAGTNFTELTDDSTAFSGVAEWRVQATHGASTAAKFTISTSNNEFETFMIAIKPQPAIVNPVPPQPEWPYGKEPVYPPSGRTWVGMPMQQQVLPRPQLMGQMVM